MVNVELTSFTSDSVSLRYKGRDARTYPVDLAGTISVDFNQSIDLGGLIFIKLTHLSTLYSDIYFNPLFSSYLYFHRLIRQYYFGFINAHYEKDRNVHLQFWNHKVFDLNFRNRYPNSKHFFHWTEYSGLSEITKAFPDILQYYKRLVEIKRDPFQGDFLGYLE